MKVIYIYSCIIQVTSGHSILLLICCPFATITISGLLLSTRFLIHLATTLSRKECELPLLNKTSTPYASNVPLILRMLPAETPLAACMDKGVCWVFFFIGCQLVRYFFYRVFLVGDFLYFYHNFISVVLTWEITVTTFIA